MHIRLVHNERMEEKKYKFVGPRLRELTQSLTDQERVEHFMRAAKVAQETVSRWNTGVSRPGPTYAKRIAKEHGVNSEWLREIDAHKYIAKDDDPWMQEVRAYMGPLPEQGKKEMVELAELVARRYVR